MDKEAFTKALGIFCIITGLFLISIFLMGSLDTPYSDDKTYLFVGGGLIELDEFVACDGELYKIGVNTLICLEKLPEFNYNK